MPEATSRVQQRASYLPSLDGWRAIAIFGVVCAHDFQPHHIGFLSTNRMHQVGWAGVDLFFAISGLLICSRLLEEERINGSISLRGFYIRPIFRILPAAYLFLAVCLALGYRLAPPPPPGRLNLKDKDEVESARGIVPVIVSPEFQVNASGAD